MSEECCDTKDAEPEAATHVFGLMVVAQEPMSSMHPWTDVVSCQSVRGHACPACATPAQTRHLTIAAIHHEWTAACMPYP